MKPDARGNGVDRLAFFSDAVFAVVLVLLATHLPVSPPYVPSEALHDALGDAIPQLYGVAVTFVAIGALWIQQHRLFDYIRGRDEALLWAMLGFLLCVVFLTYPASILSKHLDAPVAILFFAGSMTVTGLAWCGLWWFATSDERYLEAPLDRDTRRRVLRQGLAVPLIFAASAPLALINFDVRADSFSVATVLWILAIPLAGLWLGRRNP